MPEMGMVAHAAMKREVENFNIELLRPIRPMIIRPITSMLPGAFLPRYPGLKVQVHRTKSKISVFTSRLKNITPALNGLTQELGNLNHELVVDAILVGFHEQRMLSQADMLVYINRRHLSRKSEISPALAALGIIYMQGEDLTGLEYRERRRRLLLALGNPKRIPFRGISAVEERVLCDKNEMRDYCRMALKEGFKGLIMRDLKGLYHYGSYSSRDSIINEEGIITATGAMDGFQPHKE